MSRMGGFTLVEILVVVVLLGILGAIVVPHFTGAGNETRTSALLTDLRRVRSQIELYKFQHNDRLPAATGETTEDFLRRISSQVENDQGEAASHLRKGRVTDSEYPERGRA